MYSVVLMDESGRYEYVEQFQPGGISSTVSNISGACLMSFHQACCCLGEMFAQGFHIEGSILSQEGLELYIQEAARCTKLN